MTPLWSAADAVRATGGTSALGWAATGVSIDSRTLAAGDLFVALHGPNHDGHDFVAAAFERGAAAAMVDREIPRPPAGAALLRVEDTLVGLRALGGFARARSCARIVAVTGSVGKTGTKEALRLALGACGPTFVSAGSLNNHWGAPLSLARLPPGAAYGVFELGMNHPGEIAALTRLARPHIAVITTVEPAHLGFFGSVAAIAEAKAEIFLRPRARRRRCAEPGQSPLSRPGRSGEERRGGPGDRLWRRPRSHNSTRRLRIGAQRQHGRGGHRRLAAALSPAPSRSALGHERACRPRRCAGGGLRLAIRRGGAHRASKRCRAADGATSLPGGAGY